MVACQWEVARVHQILPCGHNIDYSFCPITFKLHMPVVDDERRNRIDFALILGHKVSRMSRSFWLLGFPLSSFYWKVKFGNLWPLPFQKKISLIAFPTLSWLISLKKSHWNLVEDIDYLLPVNLVLIKFRSSVEKMGSGNSVCGYWNKCFILRGLITLSW